MCARASRSKGEGRARDLSDEVDGEGEGHVGGLGVRGEAVIRLHTRVIKHLAEGISAGCCGPWSSRWTSAAPRLRAHGTSTGYSRKKFERGRTG